MQPSETEAEMQLKKELQHAGSAPEFATVLAEAEKQKEKEQEEAKKKETTSAAASASSDNKEEEGYALTRANTEPIEPSESRMHFISQFDPSQVGTKQYWSTRAARRNFVISIEEASRLISSFEKTQNFRFNARIFLAVVAIINVICTCLFFWWVPPVNLETASAGTNLSISSVLGVSTENQADIKERLLLAEGAVQLFASFIGIITCIFVWITFFPDACECCHDCCIPGETTKKQGYPISKMIIISGIWLCHCPIGIASHVDERVRFLNLASFLRLYTVVLALMNFSPFKTQMMRVMTNFLQQPSSLGAFIRWALAYHKWKVLLPGFLVSWCTLSVMYTVAEDIPYRDSMWYIIVTFTTVGYGDLYPSSISGRCVAILAMFIGLVMLAYIVNTVHSVLLFPEREKKVYEALTHAQRRASVVLAARRLIVTSFRWRYATSHSASEEVLDVLYQKVVDATRGFNKIRSKFELDTPECLKSETEEGKDPSIAALENAVWMQQQQISQMSSAVKQMTILLKAHLQQSENKPVDIDKVLASLTEKQKVPSSGAPTTTTASSSASPAKEQTTTGKKSGTSGIGVNFYKETITKASFAASSPAK